MIRRFVSFAVLVSALLVDVANGQQSPGFQVTPYGGYRYGGSFGFAGSPGEYGLDDSQAAGLILNWRHGDNTRWEVLYTRQSTDATFDMPTINDVTVRVATQALQLGGTYEGPGERVRPYLAATIGGTRVSVRSRTTESDTFLSGSIGVGALLLPDSRVGLRLEVRAFATLTDSSTDLFCRTGPDLNVCALRVEGDLMSQVEVFAGLVLRF